MQVKMPSMVLIMAPLRPQRLKPVRLVKIILLAYLSNIVVSQSNTGQDPANANALNTIFYFDSNSDCNGPIRELYGFEGTIRGNDLSSTRLGPKSCTIRLQSTGQFDGNILDIQIKAMTIQDCTTRVSIYDGDGSQLRLMSYDCSSLNYNNRLISTTGNTATFIMSRENLNSFNFDIEIKIYPRRGGTNPGYENAFGRGYFFDKFSQPAIVGMIGGFYALILIICIAIIIMFCWKYHKLNKKWESQQLSTIKPGAALENKNPQSNAWSVELKQSQGPASNYSAGVRNPRFHKTAEHSEDGDSGVLYNGDAFQTKRLMTVEKEKPRPSHVSNNASFTEHEDDEDNFVEKIITPRVKPSNGRNKQPPSYDDALSGQGSDQSSDEESEVSTSASSVRKKPMSSEEESSEKSSTESETESNSSSREARARKHKRNQHKSRRRYSDDNDGNNSQLNNSHQQLTQVPPQPQMQQVSYSAYPPGQFVPVMVGHNQFQQVTMVPAYSPQNYQEQQLPVSQRSQVHPTEPPVYSYLVRRGYTPVDASSTSASIALGPQRQNRRQVQDPDLRLESGVEYMKR